MSHFSTPPTPVVTHGHKMSDSLVCDVIYGLPQRRDDEIGHNHFVGQSDSASCSFNSLPSILLVADVFKTVLKTYFVQ